MKLSVLKKKIIKDQIEFHTEVGMRVSDIRQFKETITQDINECKNVIQIVNTLAGYGYEETAAFDLIFSYLIKN